MQQFSLTITPTTHILAHSRGEDGDVFRRDDGGNIVFEHAGWHRALSDAMASCRGLADVSASAVRMRLVFKAETCQYERAYYADIGGPDRNGDVLQEERVRVHEAVAPGTRVTFTGAYNDARMTQEQLREMFTVLGDLVGLSPFGFNLGFGRFTVEELVFK